MQGCPFGSRHPMEKRSERCRLVANHLGKKHLSRYVTQFADKHNLCDYDTLDPMILVAQEMVRK